jgi:hypothetical protein
MFALSGQNRVAPAALWSSFVFPLRLPLNTTPHTVLESEVEKNASSIRNLGKSLETSSSWVLVSRLSRNLCNGLGSSRQCRKLIPRWFDAIRQYPKAVLTVIAIYLLSPNVGMSFCSGAYPATGSIAALFLKSQEERCSH